MNSGKNLGFVLLFCSLASGLTACGDDYHYLAANVSLGGSGSGTQKPRPGGSDATGNGKGDEDSYEYYMTIPETVADECLGIQRSMQFIYADSKQPIPSGTVQELAATPLQIELRNTTPNYIFEQLPQCRQVEVWSELTNVHIQPDQYLRCTADQYSIQVLGPYETRIYEFDAKLPTDADRWKIKYTATNYGIQPSANDLRWTQCQPLEITLPVDKVFKPKKVMDPEDVAIPDEAEDSMGEEEIPVTEQENETAPPEQPTAGKPMQKMKLAQ